MHNDTKCLFVSAFPIQKAHFEEIKYKKLVWLGIKRNFLEKVAFWVCEENAQCHKGAQRRILEKACACWFIYFGLTRQLPNYPSINQKMFSVLTPDSSFLSSHLSALPFKKLIWPISTACHWQWGRNQVAVERKTGGGESKFFFGQLSSSQVQKHSRITQQRSSIVEFADEAVREKREMKKKKRKKKELCGMKLECSRGSSRENGERMTKKKREGYVCGGG